MSLRKFRADEALQRVRAQESQSHRSVMISFGLLGAIIVFLLIAWILIYIPFAPSDYAGYKPVDLAWFALTGAFGGIVSILFRAEQSFSYQDTKAGENRTDKNKAGV